MLGWEFPPLINGGLGVACHDLSFAMSQLTDITMVVPRSSPGFRVNKVNLMGLNNIDAAAYEKYFNLANKPLPFELISVPADLDPYISQDPDVADGITGITSFRDKMNSFNIDHLYGGDVVSKVFQFADITTAVAASMNFDVIHAHDWMTMIAGIKIKQATGKPLAVHIHSLEYDRSGETSRGWLYELEKKGMEYADLLLPVSNYTSNVIQKYYGISPKKIKVVHNGSKMVKSFRSRRGYKEKTVLFVGRLTRQKGPDKFLEIAARVLEKNPDVRFVMAGTGEYFRKMLESSAYKGIGNRFHVTGFLNTEKLHYLLSISDVYCMPSVSEPFGLSAVEAAQFGVPCVISKQSGVSEVLNGSLKFDHWDVNKAAEYILSLLNDSVLTEKVARDASHNLNNITWDISAKKVVEAYASSGLI